MTKQRPFDKLSALIPLPPRPAHVAPPVDELVRIMSLPRREPVDCTRDENKKYRPATQALIEHVTAQFTRGRRISCSCQPRRISMVAQGVVAISRQLPSNMRAEPPVIATVQQLLADWSTCKEESYLVQRVGDMRVGEQIELLSADEDIPRPCILQFNAQQAWTLYEGAQVGGIVGFMGVGSGKSIAGLVAPLLFPDARLAVLLIEPKQRGHYRKHYLRLREHFRVPSVVFDDDVTGYVVPGTVPTHLMSYSRLSRTENSDALDNLDPDVLILDEAHRACGDSAINRRVKRFCYAKLERREAAMMRGEKVRARATNLFDWSGTLENKTAQETHMLCSFSLGNGSPLPLDPDTMVAYSAVLDVSRKPDRSSKTAHRLYNAFVGGPGGPANDVDDIFGEPEVEIRRGFQKWRARTPGIITASASSVNAAIYFAAKKAPKMPEVVKEALRRVRVDEISAGGEQLTERLEIVAAAREVTSGFYAYWAFPNLKCTCGAERCAACRHIDNWYRIRKDFSKELRSKVKGGEVNLDSRKLCEAAAARFWQEPRYKGELPTWDSEHWPAWCAIENTVEYVEKHKWLGCPCKTTSSCECDSKTHPGFYLARDAAEWALKERGVVWFKSTPFGRKVAELAKLPYFNGGPGCEERLNAEKGDRSIICSIKALGSGTDGLQFKFSKQLITEMPASNGGQEGMEQLLGRLHREGQTADVVETYAYLHTPELYDAFQQVKMQAGWQTDMQKLQQRILLADEDLSEM